MFRECEQNLILTGLREHFILDERRENREMEEMGSVVGILRKQKGRAGVGAGYKRE